MGKEDVRMMRQPLPCTGDYKKHKYEEPRKIDEREFWLDFHHRVQDCVRNCGNQRVIQEVGYKTGRFYAIGYRICY